MKIGAWHSHKDRDRQIVTAFVEGIKKHGDDAEAICGNPPDKVDVDVAVVLGVKGRAKFEHYRAQGIDVIYLDKGYIRTSRHDRFPKYWRLAINAHHPTRYLHKLESPGDRWKDLGLNMRPWRESGSGDYVLLAGSSNKAHIFNHMPEPTEFAEKVIEEIRKYTQRPIVYRPKPTWAEAVAVPGSEFDQGRNIESALARAHVLVTALSNACFEAILFGVPCIVIGEAVARPLSSKHLSDIESPRLASTEDRLQWFADLSYCQYSVAEFAEGLAWAHAKHVLGFL